MKPYGVRVIEYPDVRDIQLMGAKSSVGHFPGRSGECHSYIRSVPGKAATRRYWARRARRESRALCGED
jgi:hypothetical protein